MKSNSRITRAALFFVFVWLSSLWAQTPSFINYQGKLTTTSGVPPATGQYSLTFSIYGTLTGGQALWMETQSVTIDKGVFNAMLGKSVPLPSTFLTRNGDWYLGIKVGTDTEMTPRFQLASVPFSHRASEADGMADDAIMNADVNANAAIAGVKINPDFGTQNIFTSGRIGIGTTSPGRALSILSTSTEVAELISQGNFSYTDFGHTGVGATRWAIHTGVGNATNKFAIAHRTNQGNLNRLVIDGLGNVGIGIDSPLAKFHVVGTAKVDGIQFSDGTTQTTAFTGGSGGQITGVFAGSGLTGGGSSGNVTLSVATNGITSAMISDGAVGTIDLTDNAVTAQKISPNIVSSVDGVSNDGGNIDLVAGSNISIIPDDANKSITISATGGGGSLSFPFYGTNTADNDAFTIISTGTGSVSLFEIRNPAKTTTTAALRANNNGANGASAFFDLQNSINPSPALYCRTSSSLEAAGVFQGSKAGRFIGNVSVEGTLTKSAGTFKIDHPLDPANKYLSHSFVESPDMMNIYNGNASLDANGEAVVVLPNWFEALNQDFRYQLTCIGGFAPVYVAQEIQGNRFKIAGGKAGLKVSWQVTGVRKDAYAQAHRTPIEQDKAAIERGYYLHPTLYGAPEEKQIEWARNPAGMQHLKESDQRQ